MNVDLSMFERFAVTFQPGDIIFCEYEPGDNFYLIQSGRVQIVKILGDIEKNIDILYPGEIFGEMAILEEAPRSATVVAIDKVKALEFNRENFEVLMKGNPQIALKLLRLFTKRIYDQKRRFMTLTLSNVEARVADVFLMLAENQVVEDPDEDERTFSATVEDVAHWAGISYGESKKVLNHFAGQRRVEIYQDKIVVKNINDFQRFVNSQRKKQKGED
ncbi:MAG TPA: Crp/Fnr family transcriptional regulator [Sediminispirochaeta sp.]|nr:Crp/Fnr family transcriptional regulator [Sediminispirochaeta sp.]